MIVNIVKGIFYIILCKVMYRVKYVGMNNILKNKNYVIAANHTSWLDGIALGCKIRDVKVLAKAELFKNAFIGWALKKLGGIPIRRGEKDFGSIHTSLNALKKYNQNLLIFPEGTRNDGNANIDAKIGAVYLAIAAGKEIVPVHISRKPKLFGKILITVGEPYSLKEFREDIKDKELLKEKSDDLMKKIFELEKRK